VTDTIARVEAFCVHLPYAVEVKYASASDTKGVFVILKITTKDGVVGISESATRPEQSNGEDIKTLAYQLETYFKPRLIGMDPMQIEEITAKCNKIKQCRSAKAMIDTALWDIKGKLLNQPVWRLLGGGPAKPVPISSIVFGYTSVKAMAKDAAKAVEQHNMRGFKIKTWKRSMEDVAVIREIRKAVGDDVFLYADANSVYQPGEARRVFPHFADYDCRMVEDPCKFNSPQEIQQLAAALPLPILADGFWDTPNDIYNLAKIDAIGAVSVKLRKTGISDAIKLIKFCEMAGLQVVLGTNTETRIGTLPMVHVWTAFKACQNIPSETGFYRHLADDVFAGDLVYKKGTIEVPDAPGFGTAIDEKKLKKYRV
jgi:L-alanine-DL-glutamate epimerase-like enolase superfamily enzyme